MILKLAVVIAGTIAYVALGVVAYRSVRENYQSPVGFPVKSCITLAVIFWIIGIVVLFNNRPSHAITDILILVGTGICGIMLYLLFKLFSEEDGLNADTVRKKSRFLDIVGWAQAIEFVLYIIAGATAILALIFKYFVNM